MDRTKVCAATLVAGAVLTALSGIPGTAEAPLRGMDGEVDSGHLASSHEAAADWLMTAVVDQQACKPSAPIIVQLVPVAGVGGTVDVDVTIEPMDSFTELSWTARCEGAAQQLDGPRSGRVVVSEPHLVAQGAAARTRPQGSASERVRLAVTPDQQAAFVVRVEGQLASGERVALRRMVRWGADLPLAGELSEPIEPGRTPSIVTLPTRTGR